MKRSLMLKKLVFLVALLALVLPAAFAQTIGTINTVAGGVPNNLPALSVGISYPTAVVKDPSGNLYVAVEGFAFAAGGVFKINPSGTLTTFVGNGTLFASTGANNGDGGPATNATLGYVTGLFLDSQQNLYISDNFYGTIRKVTASTGIITTIAGGGTGCTAQTDTLGDGCPATLAILSAPYQIFVDASQNLFIADSGNSRIREVIASTGLMQTVAGGGAGCPNQSDTVGDGCAAALATLSGPFGVYLDSQRDIFISDTGNSRIREVSSSTGLVQTIAGTGTPGYNGDSIAANTAQISSPYGLFVDPSGDVFFSDVGNSRMREIVASSSLIQTIAGGGVGCSGQTDSVGDGCPASGATLLAANGIFVDASNDLYIADSDNSLVREVVASDGVLASTDTIQAVAGNGTVFFSGDGQLATSAQLNVPYGVAVDASGNLFIADTFSGRIRKVSATTGIIQTVAGGGTGCTAQTDTYGDGCSATQAILIEPIALFVDSAGDLFISDYGHNLIREVSASTGIITTVVGGGTGCTAQTDTLGDGCLATQATLSFPWGVYVDPNGNIFFSDFGNSRIRKVVASSHLIQTIAGTGTNGYNGDNIPAVQAQINSPVGVYGDASGNIFISDQVNSRIREIYGSNPPLGQTAGNVVTVAGTGTPGYNGDNILATSAEIIEPQGIFVDRAGSLFFGDFGNYRVREVVASTGLIQTVAGNATLGFSGDGGLATSAEISYVAGVTGDPNGNLFLADTYNLRVREVFGIVPANTLAISTLSLPNAVTGTPYSFALQATGGILPYSWSITSGVLPTGMSLNASTGVISGTPTSAASFPISVNVADSATPAHIASANYTLVVQSAGTALLSVNFAGTGTGTISDGMNLNCSSSSSCSQPYTSGATVTLTATPTAGSLFFGWSGACTGSGACTLTMNSSQSVTAKFSLSVPSSCLPSDTIWTGGASGNWSKAANWSTGAVPNNGVHVCINNAKSPVSSVTLDTNVSIGGLTIDPGNSLTLADNTALTVSGTIANSGLITILSNGHNTYLEMNQAVTLNGGGTVTMTQLSAAGLPIIYNVYYGSLNNVNNTIQGAGQIGTNALGVTNQAAGTINANSPAFPLLLNASSLTNLGLLQASSGGTLQSGITIVNKGATITSTGSGSAVQFLANSDIQGGTLSTANGGTLGTPANVSPAILDGNSQGMLTLVGVYTAANYSATQLIGTINNTGIIQLNSNGNNTYLEMNQVVTLTGGGTVNMNQLAAAGQPLLYNVYYGSLTNVNNLIQGAGQTGNNGLGFTNQAAAVLKANNPLFPLQINSALTNLALIEAVGGAMLQVNVTIVNKGATIASTGSGSAVQFLANSDIQGGTLSTANGGTLGTPAGVSTVVLDGSSSGPLTNAGVYTAGNNSATQLIGTINNTGTIQLNSNGSITYLEMNQAVTLTGGGTLNMNQLASAGQPVLYNVYYGSLVNANNLIQGAGQTGGNGLGLTNQAAGVILANGAFPLVLNSTPLTNQGLILANGSPTPGLLTVTNYTQSATGAFGVALGGTTGGTQYSQWHDTGNSILAGALDIQLLGGFIPAVGNQFTILTANSISGKFSAINSPALPTGLSWSVLYNPASVVLSVVAGAGGGSSTLSVTGLGTGTGTVTDDLGLINCTTTAGVITGACSASYQSGSLVTLTATPAPGTTFTAWSSCTGTGPCSVTVSGTQSVSATFGPIGSVPLTVTETGTGAGTVTDNLGQIDCTTSGGVQTGTCLANYPPGTAVTLTATPSGNSLFAAWGGACTGSGNCSLTMSAAQSATASFVPPPQAITLTFTPGANVVGMATYNCPSNPAPSPGNPCTDPNAHALALSIPQVLQPITLTVQASEVPPSIADGICPSGLTPTQDFDCRFASFFTYQTLTNGNQIVPLCYPYANGNCVHYQVYSGTPGVEPNPSYYVGPIDWSISWNNDQFTPPAPYTGSTPHLYDDPDYAVSPASPYGTDCTQVMLVGIPPSPTNPPISCQFEFDITTSFNPTKKVDANITGRTKQFNDVVVAFPPAGLGNLTVTTTPTTGTVTAGNPLSFTIAIGNSAGGVVSGATLTDALPAGANVLWTISPAYAGPGTCGITGAAGSQVLSCSFGAISASQAFTIGLLSANSSVGTYSDTVILQIGKQQTLSIGAVTVQAVPASFSGLAPSQSILFGATSITVGGTIGNGATFPASGEIVSITINGATQTATIGSNGSFSVMFPTATIPASVSPYPITYSYAGDAIFSAVTDSSTTLSVNGASILVPLSVTLIGTGNGTVTDNLEQINCTTTAGVQSGTCSASYTSGTLVTLAATPSGNSTFAAWGSACTGNGSCSLTMITAQSVTASFVPPPQLINVTFNPGTTVTGMATYNCPSNPAPGPGNPCTDTNAHSLALAIPQVLNPITLTVQASEIPPSIADGICPNGLTPTQDFDCRFASFFTYQTRANGDRVVPLCYPYANGNCVHYQVYSGTPGVEPDPGNYVGPIDWSISWNNDQFTPPAPYAGSTPRLYDDPDYAVSATSPFGTNCAQAMQVGIPPSPTTPPIFCQFEFDITTAFDPTKKVDANITGRTKQFNDVAVAFPPANVGNLTVTDTPLTTPITAGNPIGYTIAVSNSAGGASNGATLNDVLPAGTNVNWSISPAYSGPGTCAITGAVGSQVLSCSFGTISASQGFTIGLLSAGSSIGTYTDTATAVIGSQQILSIGTLTVQGVSAAFTGLTPSQTISYATSSVNLSGVVGSGTSYPTPGETVSITINGITQTAAIGVNGAFNVVFPTSAIPPSATPYTITYSYAGDAIFTAATDGSTTLTQTGYASQTITFTGAPASAVYNSTFPVSASASSGLPVTITAGGACSISGGTVTMTSGTGTCTLAASQLGNGSYAPAQATRTVAAQKAPSATTITTAAPNPSNAAQVVTISFSVTGVTSPTGTVSVTASTGESCSGSLTSGAGSCSITFATPGTRTLVASYNGDTNFNTSSSASVSQTVNVSSTSNLVISPASVDFGQVVLGFFSLKNVTLFNKGTTPIAISKVSLASAGNGEHEDFYFQSFCPKYLAPGRNCTVLVEFVPDDDDVPLAAQSAALVITDSADGSPQSVLLTATVINPRASFSTRELNFARQQRGTTSAPQSVTLTNTGTSPLVLQSVSTTGDYALVTGTTCAAGTSLAPSQSCTLLVTFTPKAKGRRLGTIAIADNALFCNDVVLLTGTGN